MPPGVSRARALKFPDFSTQSAVGRLPSFITHNAWFRWLGRLSFLGWQRIWRMIPPYEMRLGSLATARQISAEERLRRRLISPDASPFDARRPSVRSSGIPRCRCHSRERPCPGAGTPARSGDTPRPGDADLLLSVWPLRCAQDRLLLRRRTVPLRILEPAQTDIRLRIDPMSAFQFGDLKESHPGCTTTSMSDSSNGGPSAQTVWGLRTGAEPQDKQCVELSRLSPPPRIKSLQCQPAQPSEICANCGPAKVTHIISGGAVSALAGRNTRGPERRDALRRVDSTVARTRIGLLFNSWAAQPDKSR